MNDSPFKPAWWLTNSHLQTIWPVFFCKRNIKNLPIERERIELPDGDFIDLDWLDKDKTDRPLVLILHGLEGSIDSHYAKSMLQLFSKQGWRGVFMHFRGCSGEHNRLPRSYHSGDTGDVNYIVKDVLFKCEPDLVMAAIGYSLGGNVLLKWLGETGDQNPLCAAIAVSVPFELHKAARRIQHGFSKFYQWYFIKCLRERLLNKFKNSPTPLKLGVMYEVTTMYEFDDKITAPLHGFSGVNEYYAKSSSRQYLHNISVPTLLVQAKDDPFMTADVIPDQSELPACVQLEVSESGGHVGFVMGRYPWCAEYWLEERVPAYFHIQFAKHEKEKINNAPVIEQLIR